HLANNRQAAASPLSRAQFLQKGVLRRITYPGTLAKLREMKIDLDRWNAGLMEGVNELNALTRDGRRASGDMLRFLIKRRSNDRVKHLLAEVLNSLKQGQVVLRAEDNGKV